MMLGLINLINLHDNCPDYLFPCVHVYMHALPLTPEISLLLTAPQASDLLTCPEDDSFNQVGNQCKFWKGGVEVNIQETENNPFPECLTFNRCTPNEVIDGESVSVVRLCVTHVALILNAEPVLTPTTLPYAAPSPLRYRRHLERRLRAHALHVRKVQGRLSTY